MTHLVNRRAFLQACGATLTKKIGIQAPSFRTAFNSGIIKTAVGHTDFNGRVSQCKTRRGGQLAMIRLPIRSQLSAGRLGIPVL